MKKISPTGKIKVSKTPEYPIFPIGGTLANWMKERIRGKPVFTPDGTWYHPDDEKEGEDHVDFLNKASDRLT